MSDLSIADWLTVRMIPFHETIFYMAMTSWFSGHDSTASIFGFFDSDIIGALHDPTTSINKGTKIIY